MPEITGYLEQIFNDYLSIDYYPAHFRELVIITLHKLGGNRDYTNMKHNRPISVLNTRGKIIEVIIAVRIRYMAIGHKLLPTTHFGGWHKLCMETTIHHLLEKIYAAWNNNKIAFFLIIKVSTPYPNTSNQRLLHNLQKRKIDIKMVNWVASLPTDCHTIVKTTKLTTPKLSINFGFLQGSRLSLALFSFHNWNLLEDFTKEKVNRQGYMNNIYSNCYRKMGKK